jgi:hypothetical protein
LVSERDLSDQQIVKGWQRASLSNDNKRPWQRDDKPAGRERRPDRSKIPKRSDVDRTPPYSSPFGWFPVNCWKTEVKTETHPPQEADKNDQKTSESTVLEVENKVNVW